MEKYKLVIFFLITVFAISCKSTDVVSSKSEIGTKKIKPNRIRLGETIGLISPAGFIEERHLEEAIENLEELGFRVKYNKEIKRRYGYLAGSDSLRAADLNKMFADKNVDAIFTIRGGYGCARMLDLVDYELIKENPKIIIGYSDITSLLYAIYKKTNLVCFHGPVGTSTFNDYSVNNLKNILVTPDETYTMTNLLEDKKKIKTINHGKAVGELIGGNLSIVVSMIGTKYDIDSKGKIIFLEDIGEEPYRIDRMLTQMKLAGKFDNCAGVALGVFRRCEIDKEDPEFEESLTLQQVFDDVFSDLKIPVVYGLSFGHIENKFTLPFGIKAELDADKGSITLLESAVK